MIAEHIIVVARWFGGDSQNCASYFSDKIGFELEVDLAYYEDKHEETLVHASAIAIRLAEYDTKSEDALAIKLKGTTRYLCVVHAHNCVCKGYEIYEFDSVPDEAERYGAYYKKKADGNVFYLIELEHNRCVYKKEHDRAVPIEQQGDGFLDWFKGLFS